MAGNNTFLNLARGATESTFYAHCLHDTLPKEIDVDLIIIEFAINDMRWDTRITPYMDNTKRCVLKPDYDRIIINESRWDMRITLYMDTTKGCAPRPGPCQLLAVLMYETASSGFGVSGR